MSELPADGLRVEGLSKRFRAVQALDCVNFAVPPASLTVLLGAAGAGKTTTLRAIAGLEDADAGRIAIGGRDCTRLEPRDRNVAMIFENLALYPDRTAFDNIAHPLRVHRTAAAEVRQKVEAIAATLRIEKLLHRLPRTMSGGERQRVALGRALIRQPALCLLDEPLASLDAMLRMDLRGELRRLQRELGYTFVFATPDYAEAMAIADQVVVLRRGRVVQFATAQTLYDDPVDREMARFVGAPEINLIKAAIDVAGPAALPRLHMAGALIPLPSALSGVLSARCMDLEIGLRPEHICLVDPGRGAVNAAVLDIEPLGPKAVVTVSNDAAEIRVVTDARVAQALPRGRTVGLDFAAVPLLAFSRADGTRIA